MVVHTSQGKRTTGGILPSRVAHVSGCHLEDQRLLGVNNLLNVGIVFLKVGNQLNVLLFLGRQYTISYIGVKINIYLIYLTGRLCKGLIGNQS